MSLSSDDITDIKQLMESVVSANNKVFLEAFDTIDKRFDAVNRRFDEQDEKMDEILNAVGADLAKHTAVIDDHESRIGRLERAK